MAVFDNLRVLICHRLCVSYPTLNVHLALTRTHTYSRKTHAHILLHTQGQLRVITPAPWEVLMILFCPMSVWCTISLFTAFLRLLVFLPQNLLVQVPVFNTEADAMRAFLCRPLERMGCSDNCTVVKQSCLTFRGTVAFVLHSILPQHFLSFVFSSRHKSATDWIPNTGSTWGGFALFGEIIGSIVLSKSNQSQKIVQICYILYGSLLSSIHHWLRGYSTSHWYLRNN